MIDLGLTGARAIVAGAGYRPDRAGHGRSSSLQLSRAGATVACIDIDEHRADGIVDEITEDGGKAFKVIADLLDSSSVTWAINEAADKLGGLDVAVDIIGDANWALALNFPDETWDRSIAENLTHVFRFYREASKRMVAQGTGGSLVSIASVDGIRSSGMHLAYGAAKAGVISITRTFAEELGPYGIRVNTVAPANVGAGNYEAPDVAFGTNPINPLSPPRAIDIANAVLFLNSALAARITGHTLVVDGGALARSPWGFTKETMPDH
jgi:NAD(P)-dependent dehydrogenase (short-subunit alcohol dehydrogenase family)